MGPVHSLRLSALPGVVLAAGAGSRFAGGNKLLLPFRGEALICHALRAALHSRLDPVFLVVGHQQDRLLAALGALKNNHKLRALHNRRWSRGRASSVKLAVETLPAKAGGALFLPGDMPLIGSPLINLVMEKFLRSEAKICFPIYQGHKGHPVVFSNALLGELAALEGDRSGWNLAQRHWAEALKLPLPPGEPARLSQLDIDTDEDYRRLLRWGDLAKVSDVAIF